MSAEQSPRDHCPLPLSSPPKIGVIGGGQLARMMTGPATELGVELHILLESSEVSAASAAAFSSIGRADDLEALRRFAQGVDVLTFDHEHVPHEHLKDLAAEGVQIHPSPHALKAAQDKLVMRSLMDELGLPNPRYRKVASLQEVQAFGEETGWPVVVKTPRGGYDGKGVAFLSGPSELESITTWFEDFPELLAEEAVSFDREISLLIARRPSGEIRLWDVGETIQRKGVCDEVIVPAPDLNDETQQHIEKAARSIAEHLKVTGVMALEMFSTPGRGPGFIVNELAMRPHNTGHWSMDGAVTGQFEQHLRAVADLPLGSPARKQEVSVMKNYFGATVQDTYSLLPAALEISPRAKVHHYGKSVREGRKLGHVTVCGHYSEVAALREEAQAVARMLSYGPPHHGPGSDASD